MSYPISRGVYAAALLFAVEPSDRALAGWGGDGVGGPFHAARWTLLHAYPVDQIAEAGGIRLPGRPPAGQDSGHLLQEQSS